MQFKVIVKHVQPTFYEIEENMVKCCGKMAEVIISFDGGEISRVVSANTTLAELHELVDKAINDDRVLSLATDTKQMQLEL